MSKNLVDIYKVKDKSDNWKIDPKLPVWKGSGSLRLALIAPSGYGKTSFLSNILLNIYLGEWKPENIYIWTGSGEGDFKMNSIIKYLKIPESNIFTTYNEDQISTVLEMAREDFLESVENDKTPEKTLFIFDDMGFTGMLKKGSNSGAMAEIFSNGRKFLVSCIVLVQRISQLSGMIRSQLNGCACWSFSNRELEILANDFDYTSHKKKFKEMFREATKDRHSFLTIDMTTNKEKMYTNSFQYYFNNDEGVGKD